MRRPSRTALAAAGVALIAFLLYHATLLPGFDFGDTPSFQVMGGDSGITPRDAYPLYFAIGAPFVWATGDRAHALNLASAVEGAIACGLAVAVGAELAGSVPAGAAAALLFAASYTFWSQSIIAEVYALHACMVLLSLLLLLRWERKPSTPRLAAFFLAYAVGFGNHLAMVLLLPGYTLFLLSNAPAGWRSMFAPRVVAIALGLALLGALQYAWNLHSLWSLPVPPRSLAEALNKFWFDVTKVDWRESTIANVPSMMARERLRMYLFDVRQQFGLLGLPLAALGLVQLARSTPHRGWLLAVLFVSNVIFALTYSVGDSHVFFLPSHLLLALLFAPALALLDGVAAAVPVASGVALACAALVIYQNYPALDRSGDTRPADLLSAFTADADARRAVILTDFDWQAQNGFNYYTKAARHDLAAAAMPDVLAHAPTLIQDNLAIGRHVLLSGKAREDLEAAYPGRFRTERDERVSTPALSDLVSNLPTGTRYVVGILKPPRGLSIDQADLERALTLLGAQDAARTIGRDDYAVVAGIVGSPPALAESSPTPFRRQLELGGASVDVRMESWLAFDTIRRMGFGQVVASHRHTLIIERGISFAAFDADGRPSRRGYVASLFAPEPRWAIVDP